MFIDAIAPDPQGGTPGPALTTNAARRFALATHHHNDHCDPKALQSVLGDRGYLVMHEDAARLIDTRIVQIQPVRMHEPIFLSRGGGEFVARCVPAEDGLGAPQVSWVIDGGGRRMIHCGDTAWHSHWWDIARAYGPFDVAFLPINGLKQTGGRFTDIHQPMSLTPESAADAAQALGAKQVVPIHFGWSGDPAYVEEPDALARFQRAAAARKVPVRIVVPGDQFTL